MSINVNKKTYVLVEFLNGKKKECAIVPLIWLINDRKICYWPKTKSQQIFDKFVLNNEPYDATWMKYKVHRVLKVSDDYDGITKYMDIILEHGSTEDDGLNSIDISLKKFVEPSDEQSDEQDEENTSDSSDSTKNMITKTKCKSQKNRQKNVNRAESEFSHSSSSENDIPKQTNLNLENSQKKKSSSSEKNVSEHMKNKNASTSTLRSDRKYQSSNIDGKYNAGIIPCSESTSSKNTDIEFNSHDNASNVDDASRFQENVGAVMSQHQFQKYVVEKMEKVIALCEQNNACISRLLQTTLTFLNPTLKPDGLPELPLKNDYDFQKLEEALCQKTTDAGGREIPALAYTYLKERLSTIGGADQRASVMNMLKFVITNELAMTYNWKGQNKKSFETTKLRQVITDAAKMQFKGNNSSDQCIKDAIQAWLKLAKSRYMYNAKKN